MKTRIPPPLILLAFGIAMWLVARPATTYLFTLPYAAAVCSLVAVAGFVCAGAGVLAFYRAKTTVNPHKIHKASTLVTNGIYRFTRNPM